MNITIVGGGFGGVRTALRLARDSRNTVTLISDRDYFQYYPSLYSTATGRSQMESWIPLGVIFARKDNIRVVIDSVTTIDPELKQLTGASGKEYSYDHCVLALGAVTTYFGIEGLPEYTHGVKSKEDIHELKEHLHRDIVERGVVDRTIVIIGGGPTGVELAAAMSTYIRSIHTRYGVRQRAFTVRLIEAAPRILPRMSEATSRAVQKRLENLGVVVATNKKVEKATEDALTVDGKELPSGTVIWTSGVANHPFYEANGAHFSFAPNRKVVVDKYMQAAPNVYVIGDNAATPYSGLAQTAIHDGTFVADHLQRMVDRKSRKGYKPHNPPVVVPIGRRWAAFEWKWVRFRGWPGAVVRRVADLVGYSDILPASKALAIWQWGGEPEDAYFTPSADDAR